MLIAHVEFRVATSDRDSALAVLLQEAPIVRSMSGNVKFQVFGNPEHDDLIEIVHQWESKETFDAYLGSESFTVVGKALGPKMTAPPLSKRFLANPIAE